MSPVRFAFAVAACVNPNLRALIYARLVTGTHADLLMLGGDNPTTWIVYNRLVREFGLFPIILERPVEKSTLLRNRVRKLGWLPVADQLAFITLIRPLLRYQGAHRITEICRLHDLEPKRPLTPAVVEVATANGAEAIAAIRAASPRAIIVNGTRILKPEVLRAAGATFINTHQGITPRYRGAHGAYWALSEKDAARCGVTVHIVDEGIDTGNIIGQAVIEPGPDDNFVTYPYLQTAAALSMLIAAIKAVGEGSLKSHAISGPSAVWYHPGLTQYLRGRLRGVR